MENIAFHVRLHYMHSFLVSRQLFLVFYIVTAFKVNLVGAGIVGKVLTDSSCEATKGMVNK